jgi:molybdopterin molybdotransferase
MTGAPLPRGADCVVMVEHVTREAERVSLGRGIVAGENVVPAGSELRRGAVALRAGARVDPATIAMLATLGHARVAVRPRPRVAIVATGDELVPVESTPSAVQIRDSNSYALAAQVARAGGDPLRLPPARDSLASLRASCARAFVDADLVIFSGGVSMGKYDLVEQVLGELGARFLWDGVDIRPGKPAVFGIAQGKPFLGLPGNPVSTLVTFELFARPAIERLGGADVGPLRLLSAPLAADHEQKALPLTLFAPALLDEQARVVPVRTQGSGDVAALVRATCFFVVDPGVTRVAAGQHVSVLMR